MIQVVAHWPFTYSRVDRIRTVVGLLALALVASISPRANAQTAGAFYLDRAQLSGAPDDPFMTWRPYFSPKARFYASASLGYALNPLRMSTLTDDQAEINAGENPFSNQVIAYAAAGLQINKRLAFDLMLPLALVNAGGNEQGRIGGGFAHGVALHDLRLSMRLLGIESDNKKFRWGGGGSLFVPTGNAVRFSSDGETTVWLFTNLEYDFGGLSFVGMVGPHFRPTQGPFPSALQVGNELRLSAGLFMPMRDNRMVIGAEIWGQTGLGDVLNTAVNQDGVQENAFFRGKNTQFEWLAQARLNMGKEKTWWLQGGAGTRLSNGYGAADVRVLAQIGSHVMLSDIGPEDKPRARPPVSRVDLNPDVDTDGDGFPDSIDQCPTIKEDGKPPFPDDGCPDLDRDKDGIPDARDKCPDVPEDLDGFEDEDGCPEDDADGDGILDKDDACPTVPGVKNEDPKKNGCPPEKKKRIIVEESSIQLLEPIQFEYNKATILPVSFPILDEIVDLMRERPAIRLGIYGHTDNRGGPAYNKGLSQRRAASVVQYISGKGISPARTESAGFGMERPVESNDTDEGRAKNRRVEFKILEQ